MGIKNENPSPFMAVPVGQILKAELDERGIKQREFANALGMQPSHVSELLKGKRSLTSEVAVKIEGELGLPAAVLMAAQAQYECNLEVVRQRGVEEQAAYNELAEYNKVADVQTLLKILELTMKTPVEQLSLLCEKLRLQSAAEMQVAVSMGHFRKSTPEGEDLRDVSTWVLLARYNARQVGVKGKFDKAKVLECGRKLKEIFNENQNAVARVADVCSEYGIRFAECKRLPKTRIDGYSFYEDGIPCIVVTNRYNRIDSFAFNVLHELGHLAIGVGEDSHINFEDYSKDDPEEREADNFANELLLPKSIWEKSPKAKMNTRSIQTVFTAWAKGINVNKWIVLGRVGYETGVHNFSDPGKTRHIHRI